MEKGSAQSMKKVKPFPPRRGQIKVKILGNFFRSVSTIASMAIRGVGSSISQGSPSSTAPPSSYTSEGSSEF
ncbi:hypothetical protein BVC80_1835g611 [Macleaya cordata]|uniref:Uncharacterized protein n=1 Tax=Macleaya cordata TaxID=56857 RepID=A0A200R680_MACCD|nr:hypothetical protein BVC80_1835g611 [Macleaya cordata]